MGMLCGRSLATTPVTFHVYSLSTLDRVGVFSGRTEAETILHLIYGAT